MGSGNSKPPRSPAFPWHRDNGFTGLAGVHLRLWIALTVPHADNGGLVVAPGRHVLVSTVRIEAHAVIVPRSDVLAIDASEGDAVVFFSLLLSRERPDVTGTGRVAYMSDFLSIHTPDPGVPPPPSRHRSQRVSTVVVRDVPEPCRRQLTRDGWGTLVARD